MDREAEKLKLEHERALQAFYLFGWGLLVALFFTLRSWFNTGERLINFSSELSYLTVFTGITFGAVAIYFFLAASHIEDKLEKNTSS